MASDHPAQAAASLEIEYRLDADGEQHCYRLSLDKTTARLLNPTPSDPPEWTRLGFCQCSNCPLSSPAVSHCPLALHIAQVIDDWGHTLSYQQVRFEVITAERTMRGEATAQKLLCALLGLVMATSGCPHMDFFRPLARFHLPLASTEETAFRAASAYLLRQHYRGDDGASPAHHFDGLIEIYEAVQEVNQGLAKRIACASCEDAPLNAVVLLDLFARMVPFLARSELEQLRPLFEASGR